jgi:hypothetical protein
VYSPEVGARPTIGSRRGRCAFDVDFPFPQPVVRRAFEKSSTGRETKEQMLKQTSAWGLTNRRGSPLTCHRQLAMINMGESGPSQMVTVSLRNVDVSSISSTR